MLRTKYISPLLFCFIALCNSVVVAQSSDSIANKFRRYHKNIVHEKVFLHLDKANYLTGETLWLKAYCVEAGSNIPLTLSSVLYVEITDRNGKPVIQTKLALQKGKGTGSIFLPATLASENYTVTAYTNWMKNFSKEYFFQQTISIINPFRPLETKNRTEKVNTLDIQFFPEGGALLTGMQSKIAFRVVNSNGNGIPFTGEVIDETGNSITTFTPTSFGLGTFKFTPAAGKRYKAIVIDQNGVHHEAALPEATEKGYALSVTNIGEAYVVRVVAKDFEEPVVHIFAHAKNQTIFSASAYIRNDLAEVTIPKNKFPKGISHISVFDSRLNPVAERLMFVKPEIIPTLTVSTDASTYSERRKVQVKLDLGQLRSKNETADVSISISRVDSLSHSTRQNIQTFLGLTSELRGQVESPEHYLHKGTGEEFENLMLTHGWRSYSWDKIMKSDFTYRWLPEIEGPTLEGTLLDETGKPARNIATYLSSPSRKVQLYTSTTNAEGRFNYALKDVYGTTKIYLQTKFSKDSLYEFRLESPFLQNSSSTAVPSFRIEKNIQQTLLSRSVAMQVQDIFNAAQENIVTPDTIAFYGKADETYFLDDFTRFPVMEEVMREYVKGVWVRKRQNEFYFMVLDNVNKSVFDQNPLILLDGVPVFRVNDIMNVNPLKIKKVDVLTRQFFHGKTAYAGIVSFTTYSNDLAGIKMDRRNLMIDYEGLQQQRTFFTPVYETERQRSNHVPDQRNVLLWVPSLPIAEGVTEIECFTSDLPGKYEINVQGIGEKGTPLSAQHTFTVSDFNN